LKSQLFYSLSEPQEKAEGKSYPAIFVIHGMGSNEQDLPSILQAVKQDYFIFSLRGPISQPPGFSFFTIERIGVPHREPFVKIIHDIEEFINEAVEEYPIDANQLYLLGFSQGAILSQSLVTILGNKLAGIVSLSGYLPQIVVQEMQHAPMNNVRILLAHGEQDQVIPYNWSEQSKEFFEEKGALVQHYPYTGGHFVTQPLVDEIEKYFGV